MAKKQDKKSKKSKPIYIDDGSTVSDMSGVKSSYLPKGEKKGTHYRAPLKDQFQTYIGAVKMMFLPMLAVLGIIALAYLIVYIILSL